MSTPLEKNTSTLEAILAAVNALPDAGSGGSGGVETCTVTINSDFILTSYAFTVFDTTIHTLTSEGNSDIFFKSVTVENVLCNSVISIRSGTMFAAYRITNGSFDDTMNYGGYFAGTLNAEAGSQVTIQIYDNA